MTLYDKLIAIYPTLTINDFLLSTGTIHLQNDGDEDYIKSWANSNPQPTLEQLATLQAKFSL